MSTDTETTGIEEAQAIARALQSGEADVAFLRCGETVYHAAHLRDERAREPMSSVVKLIQGIYEREPAMARKIVRNRIFTTGRATAMCQGMVKVAAKRMTAEIEAGAGSLSSLDFQEIADRGLRREIASPPPEILGRALDRYRETGDLAPVWTAAEELARLGREQNSPLYQLDRPITALLLSSRNELLGWAVNRNAINRTLHAEVQLVQEYFARERRGLPAGARLLTTLKPCRMCAGMIHDCSEDLGSLEIVYLHDDPGPLAQRTALEGKVKRWSPTLPASKH